MERDIESEFTKQCKENNVFVLKNTGMNGIPDRFILKNGKHIFIELKDTNERPRPLQYMRIQELQRNKAEVYIIDTKEGVKLLMQALCKKKKRSNDK